MRNRRRAALVALAIATGALARLYLVVKKPLWADEIFTLTLARTSFGAIVDALRVDSGPPLHYFLSHLALLPFGPEPGPSDALVRVLSLVASLLHLPLFFLVAKRLGKPELGAPAAALFSLFPLAADYAAEGRAYAVASLLVLFAFERALVLREEPRVATGVTLALVSGAAVLTHYLAVFAVAGLAWLAVDAGRRARRALVASGLGAVVLAGGWLPVVAGQPRAAMAWAGATSPLEALQRFLVNLAFGVDAEGIVLNGLLLAALVSLAACAVWGDRPVVGFLAIGVGLLTLGQLATASLLLPERTALLFLPFLALLAARRDAHAALVAAVAVIGLAVKLFAVPPTSAGERVAANLLPVAKAGARIAAVGYWGPELDYRFRRAGLPGHVILFPAAVNRHPGWFEEGETADAELRREAVALLESPGAPTVFLLPVGGRAGATLRAALEPKRPRTVGRSPFFEVLVVAR